MRRLLLALPVALVAACGEPLDLPSGNTDPSAGTADGATDTPLPVGLCSELPTSAEAVSSRCFVSGRSTNRWSGHYWEKWEMARDIEVEEMATYVRAKINPGDKAFLAFNQDANGYPVTDSVIRLEVNQTPNIETDRAQLLFGVGIEFERLTVVIERGRIKVRRDLGVDTDGDTEPDEFGPFLESVVEVASFERAEDPWWIEIREERGEIIIKVGPSERDLTEVERRPTPEGVEHENARVTVQVGRWQELELDGGTVELGTFCHCPLEYPADKPAP